MLLTKRLMAKGFSTQGSGTQGSPYMGEMGPLCPGPDSGQYDSSTDTGYYGFVPDVDLISGDALALKISLTDGTSFNSDAGWLKFYVGFGADCNRKSPKVPYVLYVAKKPYRGNLSWGSVSQVNAIYGDREEIIGGDPYKVRLLTGADADPASEDRLAPCANDFGRGSEWNCLMYRVHEAIPSCADTSIGLSADANAHGGPQVGTNWADYTNGDLGVGGGSSSPASWVQELVGSHRPWRGRFGIADKGAWGDTAHASRGWRPALEFSSS